MQFSEKLLLLRKEKGMSQEKLAEIIHVSRQAISKWELGTATPDTDNLVRISKYFQVPVEYMLLDSVDCIENYKEIKSITKEDRIQKYIKKRDYIFMNIMGWIVIVVAAGLTFVKQSWDMDMKGMAYANSFEYLKEFPFVILMIIGISLIASSIYFLVKSFR